MKSRIGIVITLAACGLLDALYLSYERVMAGTLFCPVTGEGCASVQNSWYAAPFGVPIAFMGVVAYGVMLLIAFMAYNNRQVGNWCACSVLRGMVQISLIVSAILVVIQAFLIHAFCFWCLTSAAISFVNFAVMPPSERPVNKTPGKHHGRTVQAHASPVPMVVCCLGLLLLVLLPLITGRDNQQVVSIAEASKPLSYPVKGSPVAPVKVVVYSDYQCPACSIYATQFEPSFDEKYVATGKVMVEYREFPLSIHPNAVAAAMAARIAGDAGLYWQMHDLLFARQTAWAGRANPTELFVEYAGQLGIDQVQFRTAMENGAYRAEVQNAGLAAQANNITATPTVLVNGIKLELSSWNDISVAVDKALGA